MTKLLKITSACVILTLNSTALLANETFALSASDKVELDTKRQEACDGALSACDKALNAAARVISGKNEIIKVQAEQLNNLADQNADLKSERDSIFRNPLVWFLVGTVAGGLVYGVVQGAR